MTTIKIGTRSSQLAVWQAYYVRDRLLSACDDIQVELVEIVSEGDRTLDIPLHQAGGKGLFLKELEAALLDGSIDLAVHSMKDVTVALPSGLHIPVVCEREDPRDAFVCNHVDSLDGLADEAVVGTCSLRRQCQILAAYPHLRMKNLRGNVNTRLRKLDDGEYDAIVLAAAGLIRLNMHNRIAQFIETDICLPAVGQGIVGIECREDNDQVNQLIAPLNDLNAEIRCRCERAANSRLDGGCHAPVAVYSEILENGEMDIRGLVGSLDGTCILRAQKTGMVSEPEALGIAVADDLLDQGAEKMLKSIN